MTSPHILITGANKGIGLALVAAVLEARDDAVVLLGSRSLSRGESARPSRRSHGARRRGSAAQPTSPPKSATSSHRSERRKGRLGATCASSPITIGTQPAASASKSRRDVGESPGSTKQNAASR